MFPGCTRHTVSNRNKWFTKKGKGLLRMEVWSWTAQRVPQTMQPQPQGCMALCFPPLFGFVFPWLPHTFHTSFVCYRSLVRKGLPGSSANWILSYVNLYLLTLFIYYLVGLKIYLFIIWLLNVFICLLFTWVFWFLNLFLIYFIYLFLFSELYTASRWEQAKRRTVENQALL